jgi:glycosyltransferase involved in cell wall biosynthesis
VANILFVDQYAELGGGQRILLDVVRHFQHEGFHCGVALPATGPLVDLLNADGVPTFSFNMPNLTAGSKSIMEQFRYLPAMRKAGKEIKKIAADFGTSLIFCNGPRAALPSVLAAQALGIPAICAVHLIFTGKERALLSYCFSRRAVVAVTFCSTVAAKQFPEITTRKAALVGNWVSPRYTTSPATVNAKRNFGLKDDDLVVGVLGRLSQTKGQRVFLEAAIPLLSETKNLRLIIAGGTDFEDPAELDYLQNMVEDPTTASKVNFLGSVSNSIPVLDALDILVVPSMWEEPFGLVAVEGMARGLPVIATRSGGLVDIIDSHSGLLVEKTVPAIREAIAALLGDEQHRHEMGSAGKLRAETLFSAKPRLDELTQIVRSAISTED